MFQAFRLTRAKNMITSLFSRVFFFSIVAAFQFLAVLSFLINFIALPTEIDDLFFFFFVVVIVKS